MGVFIKMVILEVLGILAIILGIIGNDTGWLLAGTVALTGSLIADSIQKSGKREK